MQDPSARAKGEREPKPSARAECKKAEREEQNSGFRETKRKSMGKVLGNRLEEIVQREHGKEDF